MPFGSTKRGGLAQFRPCRPAQGSCRLRMVLTSVRQSNIEWRRMMKIRSSCIFAFIYILVSILITTPTTIVASRSNTFANTTDGKDVCLSCHGPFDKLVTTPKTYTTESGDKINPHLYVPHNRTDEKSIAACTNCHEPHPVPLTTKAGLPKPKVDWCYSCHHSYNFSPCKTCHH